MREYWKKYQINEIIEGLFDGPHATPSPSKDGPVFLGIKNLTADGRLNLNEIRHIAEEDFPKWTKRVLPQNDDIVFTYEATLHRYGLLKNDLRCCLGRRMALLRVKKNVVDPKFLLYYFFSPEWVQIVERNIIIGATVDRIPISEFPSFELSLPNLREQTEISKILSDLDAKIDLNNRINAELEAMAKLIYDYWFVQFDFPDAEGKPYKSSGGKMVYNERLKREIPEGWEVKKLGDFVDNFDSQRIPLSKKQREKRHGKYPYYGATSVMDYVDDFIFEGDYILVAEDGSVMTEKGFLLVQFIYGKSWVNNHAHVLRAKELFFNEFLYQTAKNIPAIQITTGSIQKKITKENLQNVRIVVPTRALLEDYSRLANKCRTSLINNQKQNQHLTNLRDWLLPMLMNGQVTVKDSAIEQVSEPG